MPFLETNGCRFYYQQKGKGDDVVLIHAFTSSTAIWLFTNTIDRLAKKYRVTAYDLRGHGSSEVTPAGYRSDEMALDFFEINRELDVGRCVVVGHSFGGVIGMHAAFLDPDAIKGVIFSDTYFPGLKSIEPNMGQSEPWAELRAQLHKSDIEIGPTVDFGKLFESVKGMTSGQKADLTKNMGAMSANWIATLGRLAGTNAGEAAFKESGFGMDQIAAVACPVLALYDEYSPFHQTREFLEARLVNIKSEIVSKAKHLAPLQNTHQFLKLVEGGIAEMHSL